MRISRLYLELRRCESCAVSLLMKIRAEAFSYEPKDTVSLGRERAAERAGAAGISCYINNRKRVERASERDTDTDADAASTDEDAVVKL